ncbi:hypothetical protein ACM66B_005942 [Microbotryomycetes sp. NB124-2]
MSYSSNGNGRRMSDSMTVQVAPAACLLLGSLVYTGLLAWNTHASLQSLPEFVRVPGIVACSSMALYTLLSVALILAIWTGERRKKLAESIRRRHPLRNWGLRFWTPLIGQIVFTLNASYLYMALWIVTLGIEGQDYCFANVTGEKDKCSADGYKLGFFAAGLCLMAGLVVWLEFTMVRIEMQFEARKNRLMLNSSGRSARSNSVYNNNSNSGYDDPNSGYSNSNSGTGYLGDKGDVL